MRAILGAAIGLRWEDTWCCDHYRTTLDLGWQHMILFDLHQRYQFPDLPLIELTHHDVSLSSFVARFRFDF